MTRSPENQPTRHDHAERTMQQHHHDGTAHALHSDAYNHGVTGDTNHRNPFPGNHDHHLPHLKIDGHDHKHHDGHKHHKHHKHHGHSTHHEQPGNTPTDGKHAPNKQQSDAPKTPETSLPTPKGWEQAPPHKSPYGELRPIPNYEFSFPTGSTPGRASDSPTRIQPTYPGRDGISHI